MNKNNIFLQIASISLLVISSTSFSMKKDSQVQDSKHLYKLFNLSKKDLERSGFQKLSSDKKLMFSRGTDCQEKLFISSKDDVKKLEEVSSFKFSENGKILFCHHGKIAEIINMKNNKNFKVGEALSSKDYEEYGFACDEKHAFIVDTKIHMLNIIDFKTGDIVFSRKLATHDSEEYNWVLKAFVSKQSKIFNLLFHSLGGDDEDLFVYEPEVKL